MAGSRCPTTQTCVFRARARGGITAEFDAPLDSRIAKLKHGWLGTHRRVQEARLRLRPAHPIRKVQHDATGTRAGWCTTHRSNSSSSTLSHPARKSQGCAMAACFETARSGSLKARCGWARAHCRAAFSSAASSASARCRSARESAQRWFIAVRGPGGSACCYWNHCGIRCTTRLAQRKTEARVLVHRCARTAMQTRDAHRSSIVNAIGVPLSRTLRSVGMALGATSEPPTTRTQPPGSA